MILVIDLEATCDDAGSIPPEQMEIIEIGAVWADETGTVVDEFQAFVRPVMKPLLTNFCQQLTTISQVDIDAAATFPNTAARLASFAQLYSSASTRWGSWGQYDLNQLRRECERHAVPNPLQGIDHVNLKRQFAKNRRIREVGMSRALQILALPIQGTHHRGIDDARNIARTLPWSLPAERS